MRYLLILFFAATLGHATTSACGYYVLGEQYRIALLNPYLIGEAYSPFFYSTELLNHTQNAQRGHDRQRNIAAWITEIGPVIGTEELISLLYDTELADWVLPEAAKRFADNAAWQAINARPDLLAYVRYIKGYEQKEITYSYWDDEPEPANPALAPFQSDYPQRALAGYNAAAKGSFLQERYAYQLLLLAYYDQDEATMARYFDRHFKNKTGALADWARFHVAGTALGSGSYVVDMANAFREAPEKAIAVYRRVEATIDPADHLKFARSDRERSNLFALAAVMQKGKVLEYLREAYRLDPTNPVIDLLLVREFNKVEDWLLSHRLTGLGPALPSEGLPDWSEDYDAQVEELRRANYPKDRAYLKELRAFIDKFQPGGSRADFATLLRAQAALLDEDYRSARVLAETLPAGATDLGRQVRIIRYLARLQEGNLQDDSVREDLAEQLLALEAILNDETLPRPYGSEDVGKTVGMLNRIAAQQFSSAGDTAVAFFLHNRSLPLVSGDQYSSDYYARIDFLDRPMSAAVTDAIVKTMERQDRRSAFGRLLLASELPAVEAVLDMAGTVALRRNDLTAALAYFQRVPRGWYDTEPFFNEGFNGYWGTADRGNTHFKASPFTDMLGGAQPNAQPLASKVALVRRLLDLEKGCGGGGDEGAKACLALGQAWFNMSQLGPSWMLLTYGKSSNLPSGPVAWPNGYAHAAVPTTLHDYRLVYRAERAGHYLNCAAAVSSDREIAAALDLSQRILAYRVAETEALAGTYGYLNEEERAELRATYQRVLSPFARQYERTAYFSRVQQQCGSIAEL